MMKKIFVFFFLLVLACDLWSQTFPNIDSVKKFAEDSIRRRLDKITANTLSKEFIALTKFIPFVVQDTSTISVKAHGMFVFQRKDSAVYVFDTIGVKRFRKVSGLGNIVAVVAEDGDAITKSGMGTDLDPLRFNLGGTFNSDILVQSILASSDPNDYAKKIQINARQVGFFGKDIVHFQSLSSIQFVAGENLNYSSPTLHLFGGGGDIQFDAGMYGKDVRLDVMAPVDSEYNSVRLPIFVRNGNPNTTYKILRSANIDSLLGRLRIVRSYNGRTNDVLPQQGDDSLWSVQKTTPYDDPMFVKSLSWSKILSAPTIPTDNSQIGNGAGHMLAANFDDSLAQYNFSFDIPLGNYITWYEGEFGSYLDVDTDSLDNIYQRKLDTALHHTVGFYDVRYQPLSSNLTTYAGIAPSAVVQNILSVSNPSAVRFIKINADNSVTLRSASELLSDIGGLANPMTTLGDLIVGGSSGAATRLGPGSSGQVLYMNGTTPGWTNGVPWSGIFVSGAIGSSASVTMNTTTNYYVCTASEDATYQLPALATSRMYFIKNASLFNLTVQRAGSDQIWTSAATTSVTLTPGQSVIILGGTAYWYELAMSGSSGSSTLSSLTDVSLTSLASGDFLKYNGSAWINRTASNVRTDLGLVIGTNVQAYDADLTTYAGITPSANVQTLLGAADYSAFKTSLSLNNVDNTSDATKNSATATITNKRWTSRVGSTTSSAAPTINTDSYDIYKLTAQTADITSFTTNLSGTPVDGDILEIQITGTAARAITWGSSFVSSTVTLPTTTVTTATLTVIFQYYTTSSYGNNKWVCTNYF